MTPIFCPLLRLVHFLSRPGVLVPDVAQFRDANLGPPVGKKLGQLRSFGCLIPIEMVRIKYLNNMVEQDHRTIKKRVRPMPEFKSFQPASATLEGIEVANMIRKG